MLFRSAGAGLFARSIQKLHAVAPGFRTHGLLDVHLFPKPGGYTNLAWVDYVRELTGRIQSLPGVTSAGLVHITPSNIFGWAENVRVSKALGSDIRADVEMMMPGAFQALGIGLLRGRSFTWQDDGMRHESQ